MAFQQLAKFSGGGGLSSAVDADDQQNGGIASGPGLESLCIYREKTSQFVTGGFHNIIGRYFSAKLFELLNNLE